MGERIWTAVLSARAIETLGGRVSGVGRVWRGTHGHGYAVGLVLGVIVGMREGDIVRGLGVVVGQGGLWFCKGDVGPCVVIVVVIAGRVGAGVWEEMAIWVGDGEEAVGGEVGEDGGGEGGGEEGVPVVAGEGVHGIRGGVREHGGDVVICLGGGDQLAYGRGEQHTQRRRVRSGRDPRATAKHLAWANLFMKRTI